MSLTLKPFTPLSPSKSPPISSKHTQISSEIFSQSGSLLLELCSNAKELNQIFPLLIKTGLSTHYPIQTKLISLFSKFYDVSAATLILDRADCKSDELYHTVLKGFAKNSILDDGLSFFARMRLAQIRPVVYNFTYLLKACGDNVNLKRGKEIHSQLISHGYGSNVFAMTAVVNMYAKCGQVNDAWKVFERMPHRDLVAWNAIISGYTQNGVSRRALELLVLMQEEEGKWPDSVTLVSILPACADLGDVRIGRAVHGYCFRAGFESLVNVSTALLDMYAKCGMVCVARLVFDIMKDRNVVSWNSMIGGYAQSGDSVEAMNLFRKMLDEGFSPTCVTVMSALLACGELGDLEQGRYIHDLSVRVGFVSDVNVMNSFIAMYSKCKRVDIAIAVFDCLTIKTLVSWNAMISGYAQNGHSNEALGLFCEMQEENVKPDSFTFVSVIPAVADISVLLHGKWIHGYAIRSCFDSNIFVMTALVDMYAKCGSTQIARKLFDMMDRRNVTTWNAMIDGYGTHGFGTEAVKLFEEMRRSTVVPNDVSFLCVLSACSHSGLVAEGHRYFNMMKQDYGIEPVMDHYGSMVDVLGRAGRLGEAWDFIKGMPIEPGISVYGAMLGACKIHQNVELGEEAAERLLELEPDDAGYHVLLANIYKTASMWEGVAKVRTMMEKKGLKKNPGCSYIELRNQVHTFYSGSTNHPQTEMIYAKLEKLVDEIKAVGYVPNTNSIHDVEDDVKEQLFNTHSEKLAIAFALINTRPGSTIQIRKNLRVCGDCHNATKFISLVTKREIIVRDMQRFHHFKNGVCSCNDYW